MYIKNPHLPENDVSLFLIDRRITDIKLNNVILSYENNNVLDGIDTHPDMTFCPLNDNTAVVSAESYDYYNEKLSAYGFKLIKGENILKKDYPYDIAYNCVILDNKLFHNIKYTDTVIKKYCIENNIKMIDVKQGYTKCSTLIVDEKSVITCDRKLYETYNQNNIDALLVDNKTIKINNFDHGFIGGCGGKTGKNNIAFFGDITKHPEFTKIHDFLNKKGIGFTTVIDGKLFDYGSLIPLCTY